VHFHHENEEKLVFPFLTTKVAPPPKMSADHVSLATVLELLDKAFKALQASVYSQSELEALSASFEAMEKDMCDHLKEEEDVGLPLLRHHFTLKEFKPVEKKIVESAPPSEFGWVARPMGEAKAKLWMTETLKVPGLVQSMLLLPAVRKYAREVTKPFDALLAGAKEYVVEPPPGCACSIM